MQRRTRLQLGLLLVALPALIALFASTFMSPRFLGIQADETYSPWPAQRLLRGDLPYRDVFTHRPPLDVLGNAAAQALLGEGLTASRLLQLASMIAVGYLLFALLRRWGATLAEAGAGALVPACVCFPFWPLPASHWQALPLACAAVLALESRPLSEDGVSPAGWVLGAGVLAGLTGLVMQPEGAAICLWLAARVWGGAAPRRELALLVAGVAIPLSLCALTLALAGIGGAAFDCLVAFPLLHYKSVFNDVTLWGSAPTTFGFVRESYGAPGVSLFVLAGLLPLAALGLALERLWRDRSRAAAAALAGVVLILGLFFKGRADWMHLMFNLPFLLIAAAQLVLSSERTLLRRAAWAWLGLALLASSWLLALSLARGVTPGQAFEVDAQERARVQRLLATLPPPLRDAPALSLPYGAPLYFYRAAEAPRIDWVCLPSLGYNPPGQREEIARWLEEREVPVVILEWSPLGLGFLREPSPIRDALQAYGSYAKVGGSVILIRKGRGGG